MAQGIIGAEGGWGQEGDGEDIGLHEWVPRGLGKEQSSPPWGQRLRLAGRPQPQPHSPTGQRCPSQAPSSLGPPLTTRLSISDPLWPCRQACSRLWTLWAARLAGSSRCSTWERALGLRTLGGCCPPSPLPCSFLEQEPPFSFLLLGTLWPTAWGMTQPRPPTGVSAHPSVDSLHGPALPPVAGPGMYLLEVLTQELGSLRGAGGGGRWRERESFC